MRACTSKPAWLIEIVARGCMEMSNATHLSAGLHDIGLCVCMCEICHPSIHTSSLPSYILWRILSVSCVCVYVRDASNDSPWWAGLGQMWCTRCYPLFLLPPLHPPSSSCQTNMHIKHTHTYKYISPQNVHQKLPILAPSKINKLINKQPLVRNDQLCEYVLWRLDVVVYFLKYMLLSATALIFCG